MKRRTRLILGAIFFPALLTLAIWGTITVLHMLTSDRQPAPGQVPIGLTIIFVVAQVWMIRDAVKDWNDPD